MGANKKPAISTISPILVSPNGRYFVDRKGNPVFWLGDTQWGLLRLVTPENARHILVNRQAKGFNVILIMLMGVGKDNLPPEPNIYDERPWLDDDPLKPNEKYFQHVDKIIRLGEETGQTFVVGVYHKWHVDHITVKNARAWARWVAQRYADVPNLMWSMYPQAKEEFKPVSRELAAGLQEGDGGAHLITVHPDPSVASSSFIHDEPWLAMNMIQTCMDYDRIYETVSADYARRPVKPVVMAEGAYEGLEFGKTQSAHDIRKQAWWTQLAGGHHVYAHVGSWRAPISPETWDKWIDSPGSGQLKIFKEIMTSCRRWWDMVPDQSLFASGVAEGFDLNVAARSAENDWALVYLSTPSAVSLRLDDLGKGKLHATWIDPATGERTPADTFAATDTRTFTSPQGSEDALLYIERE